MLSSCMLQTQRSAHLQGLLRQMTSRPWQLGTQAHPGQPVLQSESGIAVVASGTANGTAIALLKATMIYSLTLCVEGSAGSAHSAC